MSSSLLFLCLFLAPQATDGLRRPKDFEEPKEETTSAEFGEYQHHGTDTEDQQQQRIRELTMAKYNRARNLKQKTNEDKHEGEENKVPVIFSVTTTANRIDTMQPMLDSIMTMQSHTPDEVHLAVPPSVGTLPEWLSGLADSSKEKDCKLKILRMEKDYGPSSKLLAPLKEGKAPRDAILIFGDDDMIYGSEVVQKHVKAQTAAKRSTAFGTKKIFAAESEILEAAGSVSLRVWDVPSQMFDVVKMPDACLLSPDYWISTLLQEAEVDLALLPGCSWDDSKNRYAAGCGKTFGAFGSADIEPLSKSKMDDTGMLLARTGGTWKDQFDRYDKCRSLRTKLNL